MLNFNAEILHVISLMRKQQIEFISKCDKKVFIWLNVLLSWWVMLPPSGHPSSSDSLSEVNSEKDTNKTENTVQTEENVKKEQKHQLTSDISVHRWSSY